MDEQENVLSLGERTYTLRVFETVGVEETHERFDECQEQGESPGDNQVRRRGLAAG